MKKLLLFFFSGLTLLSFTSCKKAIAVIFGGTEVTTPVISDTIPVIPYVLPAEVELGRYTFDFNLDSNVRANTAGIFGANAVNSIKLKQFIFQITNGDTLNNIANLETARIELTSNSDPTPAEILNTTIADSTAYTYTYTPVTTPELLAYAKGTKLTYIIYGKVRRVTTKPLLFSVYAILKAD
ncbi:MAG TPA: hypothetical protein VG847_14320 [Chitinophagaceae bacterium]|nr:hypothetical protein [Chitinophagaceae bacterium]